GGRSFDGPAGLGVTLARIGILVDRKEWVDQGIKITQKALADSRGKPADYFQSQNVTSLAGLLVEVGRGAEAETVLADAIADAARADQGGQSRMTYGDQNTARVYLIALAQLYAHAGRDADVLVLLDDAPQWGAKDLAEIYQENGSLAMFQ